MSFYDRLLRQKCTYWGRPTKNAWGDRTYPSPAILSCHWEEKAQLFIDKTGAESNSHAVVLVESEVEIDGSLFFGESDEDNPNNQDGSDTIRMVERVATIRGNVVSYRALL